MKQLIIINRLARICGYANHETDVNNGYGCNHIDCRDVVIDENGKEQGRCYTFSCPIAHEADLEDLRNLDHDLYQEHKGDALPDGTIEDDWMVYDDREPLPEPGEGVNG